MYSRDCPSCGTVVAYASKSSMNRANRNGSICTSCVGDKRRGAKHSAEVRHKISVGHKGKPSHMKGKSQSDEWIAARLVGRYGVDTRETPKEFSRWSTIRWSKDVRDRDGKCMSCGSTEDLHAHHKLPKAKFPKFATELWNGITMCHACHWDEHRAMVMMNRVVESALEV